MCCITLFICIVVNRETTFQDVIDFQQTDLQIKQACYVFHCDLIQSSKCQYKLTGMYNNSTDYKQNP